MTQEALKLALEALEDALNKPMWDRPKMTKAITAIKEALREHAMREVQRLGQEIEQEPVKMIAYNCTCGRTMKFESVHGVVAPQRTWVGLTNDELTDLFYNTNLGQQSAVAQAIALLEEKNT